MSDTLQKINEFVEKESAFVEGVTAAIRSKIVGQQNLIDRLIIGLLTQSHVLIEGVPGLAKTLTVHTLAQALDLSFSRIQFTPDLLPADIIGTMIYNQSTGNFTAKKGPIFANCILADEINRAPAKVQSALLEAMQEKQVTLGDTTHKLDAPFMVLATQNPVEQDGTYPLPEAQLDRFLMKITIDYPSRDEERLILDNMDSIEKGDVKTVINAQDIVRAQSVVEKIYVDGRIKDYVLDLVFATRNPDAANLKSLAPLIRYGASPRASLALIKAAKAHAFINRRGYVTPDDVKAIGRDVLRHRVIPTFEAEAEELTSDDIVDQVFSEIIVP
ncbi:MAG: MoxR family ATPase [bacterium]|nr:MoxR family ATPase [bacterium]